MRYILYGSTLLSVCSLSGLIILAAYYNSVINYSPRTFEDKHALIIKSGNGQIFDWEKTRIEAVSFSETLNEDGEDRKLTYAQGVRTERLADFKAVISKLDAKRIPSGFVNTEVPYAKLVIDTRDNFLCLMFYKKDRISIIQGDSGKEFYYHYEGVTYQQIMNALLADELYTHTSKAINDDTTMNEIKEHLLNGVIEIEDIEHLLHTQHPVFDDDILIHENTTFSEVKRLLLQNEISFEELKYWFALKPSLSQKKEHDPQ